MGDGRRYACPRCPAPFLLYIVLSVAVVTVWVLASLTVFSESHLSSLYPRYCSLAPPFPNRKNMLSGSGPSVHYSLVRIRDARVLDSAPASPDVVLLFVHGHHGGAGQADTIAYATAALFASSGRWAETYAVDFNSGSSAFDAAVAHVQVGFVREALGFVAGLHPGVEIVLIAHSMGGVISRAALAPPIAVRRRPSALITINSPLKMHPLLSDPGFTSLYDVADDSLGLAFVSIVGGHRDTLVPSTFGVLKAHSHLLTLFTASMRGVWTDLGHDDAMACTELWKPLLSSVVAATNSTQLPSDRIRTFRRHLQAPAFALDDRNAGDAMVQENGVGVYRVLSPSVLLSTQPCSQVLVPAPVQLVDVPVPYTIDHDAAKLQDFAGNQADTTPTWQCLATISDPEMLPINVTSPVPLTYGAIRRLDLDIGLVASSSAHILPRTAGADLTFTVREPWSAVLWSGLVPAVFTLTLRRQPLPGATSSTPELLVVQSDDPASGELRWFRNTASADVWRATVAFHPGPSKSLRGRLILSPDRIYDAQVRVDLIATLGAGLRLADKSALISPFVSIVFYQIAGLPYPTLAAALFLPLVSWAASQFVYDDDWSSPKFGIVLNLALFWIGISVLTLVTAGIRVFVYVVKFVPGSMDSTRVVSRHPRLISLLFLALIACLGPWPFVAAIWIFLAAKWVRSPPPPFRALVLCAYFTVVGLKATLVFSVWHRLVTTRDLSWASLFLDTGPGLGSFFGHEIVLAAPIGVHMALMLWSRRDRDLQDEDALWLRTAAAFTCFVTLSAHYRLFEFIFATSLFAFCCCFEQLSARLRRSKDSIV